MDQKIERILQKAIGQNLTDPLGSEMIFLTGPRQSGKTFVARELIDSYFNWDTKEVKKSYLKDPYFFRSETQWHVFDEIHKRRDWKKLLKGYFDSADRRENFLVTGSGRFDQYQKGGDSLQGRYHTYQLWPLVLDEVVGLKKNHFSTSARDWSSWEPDSARRSDAELIRWGGFPKPFIKGTQQYLNQWLEGYLERLIKEDVRDFAQIQRLDQLELLVRVLPSRVMSPLSYKSLGEDLDVSPITIKNWIRLLEVMYFGFSVKPFHYKVHRAVKKEAKWYFYQWAYCEDPAARFENYLAVQLSAACTLWTNLGFGKYELYYIRDQDRREVDFCIARNLKPIAIFEAKSSFQPFPSSLQYYSERFKIPAFLVYPLGKTVKFAAHKWALPSSVLLDKLLAQS